LLPAYPGLQALERNFADAKAAAEHGTEIRLGATIHLVNDRMDNGPIISQRYFTFADAPTLTQAQHICYLYKVALVLECVCKYMDGTLPALRDIPERWDWVANYALWKPYEPITDVHVKLAEPWAVEWLRRKVHEGTARLVRKVLHA
jgi:methionyl-tRNA formyltransferase